MRLIAALALLLAPFSAQAGQRAIYTDDGKQQLVILVADNGHARVNGPDPEQYGCCATGNSIWSAASRGSGRWRAPTTSPRRSRR